MSRGMRLDGGTRGPIRGSQRLPERTAGSTLGPMPCLLGCLALSMPRLVLFLVWFFSDYLHTVYDNWLWPLVGFVFLPLTTLAYAFAMHWGAMQWTPVGIAAVVTAVLVDLGLFRTGAKARGKAAEAS